jgi:chemotaxis protein CheZ
MKMDTADTLAPTGTSPEVFQQLGQLTRQLHDTLTQLGVMPSLKNAAHDLPDARSRLNYIASKTGDAANKVLNSVDQAKLEQARITRDTRRIAEVIAADPALAVTSGAVMNFVAEIESATARVDAHLTDIMLAQDFHDLTGQVVARVVALAGDLEDSLVKLLLQAAAPQEPGSHASSAGLHGPVINPEGRTDVVANQREVDDLLANMGF